MTLYKIENNIPIPPRGKTNGFTQTIRQLKVGQSVLLPITRAAAGQMASKVPFKITTRKEGDGIRFWRID